jgi:hypothetical protein
MRIAGCVVLCVAVVQVGGNPKGPPLRACSNMLLAITAHAHCRLCGAVRGCGAGGRKLQGPAAVRLFQHDPNYYSSYALQVV